MEKKIRVAFVGQPNVGKSSLIYQIAGGDVQIGNWPGITVQKHTAYIKWKNYELELIDLPGVYNLSPYTPEERITRDFLLFEKPDVVVNVIETPMLERNLFLTSQVLEFEIPTVLALNMWDEFTEKGYSLDLPLLERELNLFAVPVIGKTGYNKEALLEAVLKAYEEKRKPKYFRFSQIIERTLEKIWEKIKGQPFASLFPKRWLSIKTLEGDGYLEQLLSERFNFNLKGCCREERHYISEAYNMPPEEALTEERYKAIALLVSKVLKKPEREEVLNFSERLDHLLLNPFVGLPLFFLIMFLVFKFTFDLSAPFMDWLDGFINGFIGKYTELLLIKLNAPEGLVSFVIDGLIGGIGFFATFIPVLTFMYLALGFLEQSGYFARAAYITDHFMKKIGLTGKSVVPMLLGFGCNVPAVLATRTLENELLRRLTALLIPFMSCSARLPVYALIAMAFFPDHAAIVIFGMYLLGIAVAVLIALLLKETLYKKTLAELPFIVELPPFRMPSLRELLRSAWTPVWEFVHRAGTVIFFANLAVWALLNIPYGAPPKETLLGKFSTTIQPLFKPAGFGEHWENVAVLVPGFLAKEVVVTSYATILGVEEKEQVFNVKEINLLEDLKTQIKAFVESFFQAVKALINQFLPGTFEIEKPQSAMVERIKQMFTPASALAFIVFVLLYTPCAATVAVMFQEFGLKFALLSVALNLSTAWILSVITYQVAKLFL